MHIKLVEPGFQSYTGLLGEIEFEEGLSVESLSRAQADRIASSIRVETVEGEGVGSAHDMLDRSHQAEIAEPLETQEQIDIREDNAETERQLNELAELNADGPVQDGAPSTLAGDLTPEAPVEQEASDAPVENAVVEPAKHTAESLGLIADEKGIQGLREIAEALDVKGNSIAKLIEGILAKQA